MSDFLPAFEDLLVQIRKRGFKADSSYINYLFHDLQEFPKRADAMFKFYGVIR